jgi:peptidoglycan/LPS O-acetylase OafA/YrhL
MSHKTKNNLLTKVLAIVGTILVWSPVVFTVVIAIIGTMSDKIIQFNYLMPAELCPFALAGVMLLLWASRRARLKQKIFGWGLGSAIFLLISTQLIANLSGLATREVEPSGWAWILGLACIALYSLILIQIGIAGILLIKELWHSY